METRPGGFCLWRECGETQRGERIDRFEDESDLSTVMKDLVGKGEVVDTGGREEGRHVELRSESEPRTSGSQTWLPVLASPGEL